MRVVGDVEGQTAVIVDDIVDTAGTLATAAAALQAAGATDVIACCTHAVLSDQRSSASRALFSVTWW